MTMTNEEYQKSIQSLEDWYENKIVHKLAERDAEIATLEAEVRETRRLLKKICRKLKIKINEVEEYDMV